MGLSGDQEAVEAMVQEMARRSKGPPVVVIADNQLLSLVAGAILGGSLVKDDAGNYDAMAPGEAVNVAIEIVGYTVAIGRSGAMPEALKQAVERARADIAARQATP